MRPRWRSANWRRKLGTPRLEYPQLARAVYFTSREGQEIRDDLYMAVATVLAFVFGLNDAKKMGAAAAIDVPTDRAVRRKRRSRQA